MSVASRRDKPKMKGRLADQHAAAAFRMSVASQEAALLQPGQVLTGLAPLLQVCCGGGGWCAALNKRDCQQLI